MIVSIAPRRMALGLGLAAALFAASPATAHDEDDAAFGERVRAYLMENPEVIVEALEVFQSEAEQRAAAEQQASLDELAAMLFNNPDLPTAGNPDGETVLVEFFDYECGFCKRAFPDLLQLIEENDDLKVVFVEYPILSPSSNIAARAALAADMQGKYMEYHTRLMQYRGRKELSVLRDIAEEVGLDMQQFDRDRNGERTARLIEANKALASSLQIAGTPAFVFPDKIVPGAVGYEKLEEQISAQRGSN